MIMKLPMIRILCEEDKGSNFVTIWANSLRYCISKPSQSSSHPASDNNGRAWLYHYKSLNVITNNLKYMLYCEQFVRPGHVHPLIQLFYCQSLP